MTKKAAVIIAVIGILAAAYVYRRSSHKASSSNLPAPAITLTDLGGNALTPSGYRGKVVLINFWAAWCTPCRDEIPQFMALQKKYGARGFQSVGISLDDPESALRDFCRDKLAGYKIPRKIIIAADLPRGPTGKILKRKLHDLLPADA